ncbi:hypothetical protein GL270_18370 [Aeromonas veronii]|uniref:hypothetical protein n=1 Tax=Aeromonas veronii TaxID=654 RepID=UPI001C5AC504|nr:hypothetical protein [Aeromonas veronii]MBW3783181.1 hypothetical protein [Aeromonas veronii]
MSLPKLLIYASVNEYRKHYERYYQRGDIRSFDDIRIYFKPQKFGHAFYENAQHREGPKDVFSEVRAQRMDWIKATLEHPDASLYKGWNKEKKCYEEARRVSVVYENFVVVIELSLNKEGKLKGNFVTCYVADQSIDKIEKSPAWDRDECLRELIG